MGIFGEETKRVVAHCAKIKKQINLVRGWRGCSEEALKVVAQFMRHRAAISI